GGLGERVARALLGGAARLGRERRGPTAVRRVLAAVGVAIDLGHAGVAGLRGRAPVVRDLGAEQVAEARERRLALCRCVAVHAVVAELRVGVLLVGDAVFPVGRQPLTRRRRGDRRAVHAGVRLLGERAAIPDRRVG